MFINRKEKSEASFENVYFPVQFCLGSISKKSGSEEVSFKENIYDFSVDYNAIDKCEILNTHKYFMVKKNMK